MGISTGITLTDLVGYPSRGIGGFAQVARRFRYEMGGRRSAICLSLHEEKGKKLS